MIATVTIESPLLLLIISLFASTLFGLVAWCLITLVHLGQEIIAMQEQVAVLTREIERMRNGR